MANICNRFRLAVGPVKDHDQRRKDLNPKSQDVVKQAIKGIPLAQRNYEKLSNGDWLVGCEYSRRQPSHSK